MCGTQACGLCAQRGFSPLFFRLHGSGVKLAGAQTWKSVLLHNTGFAERRLTNQRLLQDSFGSLLIDKIGRGNVLRRYAYRFK